MADRFVLVSTRKWRDPWYRTLSLEERQVWNYLTEYPDETQTGIIERLHEDMATECQMKIGDLEGAFARFEHDGKVAFEGENFLFVRRWLRHQIRRNEIKWEPAEGKKGDNRGLAINLELERLRDKCPTLVAEFEHIYKGLQSPYDGANKGLRYINININNNINNNITPQENERDLPPEEPKKESPAKPKPSEPEKYLEMATLAATNIQNLAANHGVNTKSVKPNQLKDAREIRLLVETDGVPLDEIILALGWAWANKTPTFHWGTVLMSIQGWRKGKAGEMGKFCKMHNQFRQTQPTPAAEQPQKPHWTETGNAKRAQESKAAEALRDPEIVAAEREEIKAGMNLHMKPKPPKRSPAELEQMELQANADQTAHEAKQEVPEGEQQ